jgi:hypothetical protein
MTLMEGWTPTKLEVRDVPGKGLGVVATEDIPADTMLGTFNSVGECFCMMVGDFRFANHSDTDPNIAWRFRDGMITFYSLQPIRAGDELVYDYACQLWFYPI